MKIKKSEEGSSYVLDSSAILCLWLDEEGSDIVESILRNNKKKAIVSVMTLMEVRYILWKEKGKNKSEEFHRYIDMLPVEQVNIYESILNIAVEIKATNRLSIADSFIVATAISRNATLVHQDPEFEQVKEQINILTLPYKSKKTK